VRQSNHDKENMGFAVPFVDRMLSGYALFLLISLTLIHGLDLLGLFLLHFLYFFSFFHCSHFFILVFLFRTFAGQHTVCLFAYHIFSQN
jgi:hypothetical protein